MNPILGGGMPGMPGLGGLGGTMPGLGLPGMGLPGMPGLGMRPPLGGIGAANIQAALAALQAAQSGGLPGITGMPKMPGLTMPGGKAPGMMGLLRPPMLNLPGGGQTSKASGPVPAGAVGMGMSKATGPPLAPGLLTGAGSAFPTLAAPAASAAAAASGAAPCTVYVGRISSEVSDDFVKSLLEKCGKVTKWNRAADPNTSKLTSFGFCDFEEPEGVWRALECLHEKQLCDKRLLVKCEEKAKQTIDVWKDTRRQEFDKKRKADSEGMVDPAVAGRQAWAKAKAIAGAKKDKKDDVEDLDAEEKKEEKEEPKGPLTDAEFQEKLTEESKDISSTIATLLKDKNKSYPELTAAGEADKDNADNKDEEKAKKELEQKDADKGDKGDKENDKKKENDKADDKKDKSEDRGKKRTRSEQRKKDKEDEIEKEKKACVSRHYRPPRRERDREQRVRERERDIEKEYLYRVREFERNEDNRIKNLKRDLRTLEAQAPSEREIRKFCERDLHWGERESEEREWKRYRQDRERERVKEKEKDNADRALVQREVEDEKAKLEEEEADQRKKEEEEEERQKKEIEDARRKKEEEDEAEKRRVAEEEQDKKHAEEKKKQEAAAAKLLLQIQEELKDFVVVKPKGPVVTGSVDGPARAGKAEEEEKSSKRRESDRGSDRAAEPAKPAPAAAGGATDAKLRDDEMRRLIQQVPTGKAQAFAFDIDWDVVHSNGIIEKKLRPWVRKKVTEFLGAEEQGMIEFIMRKVTSHTPPATILAELEGFIDDEAENFTLKMWRMLIFEVLRVKAR